MSVKGGLCPKPWWSNPVGARCDFWAFWWTRFRPTGTYYTCCWFWHLYNSKLLFKIKFSWQISCLWLRYCATVNAILLLECRKAETVKNSQGPQSLVGGSSAQAPRWLRACVCVYLRWAFFVRFLLARQPSRASCPFHWPCRLNPNTFFLAFEMTYIVSGGALNSTRSPHTLNMFCTCLSPPPLTFLHPACVTEASFTSQKPTLHQWSGFFFH